MPGIFGDASHATVNILGHAAGVLVFGIFLGLMFRHRSIRQLRSSRLSIAAAALAFLWNVASLAVLLMDKSNSEAQRIVAGMGFCVLSLLPAVLLNLCLVNRFPAIVRAGYVLSLLAVAAHAAEFLYGPSRFHRFGLAAITIGFGLLTVASVLRVAWSGDANPRALSMRILATMSLFLFAASFVHFNEGQSHQAWSTELAIHHAGIPLALFMLMQDYRFVLLDAFVRFLVNGLLAALFGVMIVVCSLHLTLPYQVLIAAGALSAFAAARACLQRLLTRLVFRQPDHDGAVAVLRSLGAQATDQAIYFRDAGTCLAGFMDAETVPPPEMETQASFQLALPTVTSASSECRGLQEKGVEVVVPVRYSNGDRHYVLLGGRRGGRRYLSEDLLVISRLAACIGEQVERIRETETRRLVSQAELRALQAQIHPHFLFNALNTLYGIIPREVSGARRMVLNLSEIFRYFLQSERTYIPLEEELRIVRAYLGIEELRFGDKLRISMDVDEAALRSPVPVLSIQPLVENAVKHGIAARPEGGALHIEVKRCEGGLRISIHDSGPGFGATGAGSADHTGVGLENVSKRLALCYGPSAQLHVESTGDGTTVSFIAPTAPA